MIVSRMFLNRQYIICSNLERSEMRNHEIYVLAEKYRRAEDLL